MSTTEESYESEHDPIDHRVRDRYFKPHAQALLHFFTYSMSPGTIAKLKPALTCHVAAVSERYRVSNVDCRERIHR